MNFAVVCPFSIIITIDRSHRCNHFPKVIAVSMMVVYNCSMVLLKSFNSGDSSFPSDFIRHL